MDNLFLVAKYVPDVSRMEPRNMGIIFWANGQVRARFADSDSLGVSVDEANYSRWVDYWQKLADSDRLQIHSRRPVRSSNPRFLKEFQRTQKGNYILEAGGEIVEQFESVDDVADFLFETIVATTSQPREAQRDNSTKQLADSVLQIAGLSGQPDFVQNYPLPLRFGAAPIEKQIHFHYALTSNGHPRALLLRVNPAKELSVTSTIGKFGSVESLQVCPKERCFSLFDGGDGENNEYADTIDFLSYWSVPVDVSSKAAPEQIRQRIAG